LSGEQVERIPSSERFRTL